MATETTPIISDYKLQCRVLGVEHESLRGKLQVFVSTERIVHRQIVLEHPVDSFSRASLTTNIENGGRRK